ncbi:hypothetical protein [Paraburkholderia rhizosphaerae]|nr:hypothetical protein [Paraburkholderia rhizosphaerae]
MADVARSDTSREDPGGFNQVRRAGQAHAGSTAAPVLRLRGGGNLHPSGDKRGDRERLLPDEPGSSNQRMYHGTRSGTEAQRAANDAKRYDLQSRLDHAKREMDGARQKYDGALADLGRISEAVKRLDDESRQSGLDTARRDELGNLQRTARDDFWRQTREIEACRDALRKSDDKCRDLERKLDKLRWT